MLARYVELAKCTQCAGTWLQTIGVPDKTGLDTDSRAASVLLELRAASALSFRQRFLQMQLLLMRLLIGTTGVGFALLLCSCAGSKSMGANSSDFSMSASPGSVAIQAGGAGAQVSVLAVAVNSFSGTIAIAVSGFPVGVTATPASLHLSAGQPQSVTLAASSSAAAATATIMFTGTSGSLSHSASLALSVTAAAPPPPNAPDVTTFHFDNARDGLNPQETKLTLSNVNSAQFGKVGFDTVDGLVDAEPLFLADLNAGGTVRNVLFVATEHDSVYAFDADTGAQIWKTSVLGIGRDHQRFPRLLAGCAGDRDC